MCVTSVVTRHVTCLLVLGLAHGLHQFDGDNEGIGNANVLCNGNNADVIHTSTKYWENYSVQFSTMNDWVVWGGGET